MSEMQRLSDFDVKFTCELMHSQIITYKAMTIEQVRLYAGLVDGTSPFYKYSPLGTNSVIGKCGMCGRQLRSEVVELVKEKL